MLVISHISYSNQEIVVANTNEVSIKMTPDEGMLGEFALVSKGNPTRVKDAAFSVDLIGQRRIRQLPTTSVHDALVYSTRR